MISIEEIHVGEGPEAKHGDIVELHYRGTFLDGNEFDSSHGQNTFSFQVGAGRVIQGFDMMVLGMRPGGKRKATIPPEFGYGARGSAPVIPPNTTLVFEVDLVSIK